MSWNVWRTVRVQQDEIELLRRGMSVLREDLRVAEAMAATEAELRAQGEVLALRGLIRDLVGGKPNIDRFLDVLGDYSHLFEVGPLEGDMEKVLAGDKPQPGDRGEPLPPGTQTFHVTEDAYAKQRT